MQLTRLTAKGYDTMSKEEKPIDWSNKAQLVPSGLGYRLERETFKELPCGCTYFSPYGGCWVRELVCEEHRAKRAEAKLVDANKT